MPVNMKKICLSLILLMSSPWLMATENKKPANAPAKAAEIPNTFTVKTRPEIVGLWEWKSRIIKNVSNIIILKAIIMW